MFYQTKVKAIFSGGIIDAHNKRLVFAGNKLARVGDLVWTDGSVVLGHTPIRGGGAFFDYQQLYIPVLCDDLQGYFDIQGNFHSAKLPVSWCFVNDDQCYYQLPIPDNLHSYSYDGGLNLYRVPKPPSPWDYSFLLDAEIAVDINGKTEGIRYAIGSISGDFYLHRIRIFKNGEPDAEFQSKIDMINNDTYPTWDGLILRFLYFDKQDMRFYIMYNYVTGESPEGYTGNMVTTPSHHYVHKTVACIENNDLQELPAWFNMDYIGSYYVYDDVTWHSWQAVLSHGVVTARSSAADIEIPLQDSYTLKFNTESEGPRLVYYPYQTTLSGYIFDEKGVCIIPNFPLDNAYRSIRSVTKLKNGCLIGTTKNELWKYTVNDGLQLVGTGLKNFRLRKMKNVLHAKVIS